MSYSGPLAVPIGAFSVTVTRIACLSFGIAIGGALAGAVSDKGTTKLPEYFLIFQDAPILLPLGVFSLALGWSARNEVALSIPRWIDRPNGFGPAWAIAIIVACAIFLGSRLVCQNFALSPDEFMADFDATIIASGRLIAPVAPEWREYVPALAPTFRLAVPENAYWISSYLPMNAALRAVFLWLGAPAIQGSVLAALAVIALFAVARRLWPDRPDAAVVSVLLLACSPQFLISAMTPYAMTAHLALNMAWLWLFLRDTRTGHLLAAGVAFVACGLHQVIFHPLFAAPFLISLLIARRWKLATFYAAVYAAIGLFWIFYWSLILHAVSAPIAQSADVGILYFVRRVSELLFQFSPSGIGLMGLNLLRFLAWQSPLTVPLAFVGLLACRNRDRIIIDLALGIAFLLAAMLILLPDQGHGWGYRYLHGFLGSFSLLAAQGWVRMTHRHSNATKKGQPAFLLLSSMLVSMLVMLPWHAYQVRAFVKPYASAAEAIGRSDADVVVIDPINIWFGVDLVRNDPFLRASPKVLALGALDEAQLTELCQRYDVAVFDRRDASQFKLRVEPTERILPEIVQHHRELREAMSALNCGRRVF